MRQINASTACVLAWAVALGGCLEHEAVDLSGKECPCAEGWTCDESSGTCVPGSTGGGPARDAGPGVDGGPADEDGGPADEDGGPMEEDAGPMVTGTFWFEAEDGAFEAPMQTADDADASGGTYVTTDPATESSTGARPTDGRVSFTFTVEEAAEFRAWGRALATMDSDDSFWVCMDDCPDDGAQWNDLVDIEPAGDWHWDDIHDTLVDDTVAVTWTLDPGEHTLHVYRRETGAQLDKIVITDDPDLAPSGLGE